MWDIRRDRTVRPPNPSLGCKGPRKVSSPDALSSRCPHIADFLADRIRNAHILLVNLKALGSEIAKNLVLAGVGSLTIVDHELVMEDDLGSQFFISEGDIGKKVSVYGTLL